MRRKDKEINNRADMEAIIKKAAVCRLGMVDNNLPYIVPLNYGFQDNTLYFHSALKGRKIDLLEQQQTLCFEIDLAGGPIAADRACDWGMTFQSVIGYGKPHFIDDPDEKKEALAIIMAQYSDQKFDFPADSLKATRVFKVVIDQMSGKQSGNPVK